MVTMLYLNVRLMAKTLDLTEITHCMALVPSLTGYNSTENDNMLLFVDSKATKS